MRLEYFNFQRQHCRPRDLNLQRDFLAFDEDDGDSRYGYNDLDNEEEDQIVYY